MHRTTRLVAAAALAVSMLASCSDGADNPGADGNGSSSPDAPAVQELAITGVDYGYKVEGEVGAGLTRISFSNTGKEEHMTGLGKLQDGKTLADVQAALKSQDEAAFGAVFSEAEGDANAPQLLSPGYSAATYVELTEGTYALVCFIPAPDGKPHFEKGMLAEIEVGAAKPGVADSPPAEGAVELSFKGGKLTGPATLPAGKTVFKVTTDANHELFGVVGVGGKTAAEGLAYFEAKFESPTPPAGPPAGAVALQLHDFEATETIYVEVDLAPGELLLLCTLEKEGAEAHDEKLTIKVA